MSVALFIPPFTQLNTPYPSTAYIKGFLNTQKIDAFQADLGLEVAKKMLSADIVSSFFSGTYVNEKTVQDDPVSARMLRLKEQYITYVNPVVRFLQGKNQTFANLIATGILPDAKRNQDDTDLEFSFGTLGITDKAKYLATRFLEDLEYFIHKNVDSNFGFTRYAEKLGRSANTFDELYNALLAPPTFTDRILFQEIEKQPLSEEIKFLLLTVPFPGNLYSAFRIAQYFKENFPEVKIALGGGFANTELRSVSDPRVFEFIDFITLDDGEAPVLQLIKNIEANDFTVFKRTFFRKDGIVYYLNNSTIPDFKQNQLGTPDYSDLPLNDYMSLITLANPMHKLWSDGRWNKLTMAHGCYWGKCTFCDISLDYISIYEPATAKLLCDRVEELIAATGETGFHFVDEAAPPALMKAFALEVLRRKLVITWWANIRFEKNFTTDLCQLLAKSGCIAVSGGLEVASDRLLKLIDKGVTVAQVAEVTRSFTEAGILVHAYLMYGYPTQTVQETIDSLEMTRQLFEAGVIQSGFWHQFALTAHAPIAKEPERYGVKIKSVAHQFALNDIEFTDVTGIDHNQFSAGLKHALYNFMHGTGFEIPLQNWFDFRIPKTTIGKNYISDILKNTTELKLTPQKQLIFLGTLPRFETQHIQKKGITYTQTALQFTTATGDIKIKGELDILQFMATLCENGLFPNEKFKTIKVSDAEILAKENDLSFELFTQTKAFDQLRKAGLLIL